MSREPSMANLLRELRETRGISARRIEQLGGPSRKLLREYESGERVPTEQTTMRLLSVLGVPDDDPRAIRLMIAVRKSKGLPTLQEGLPASTQHKLTEALVDLIIRLDGRPRTELLELSTRNEVDTVLRRVLGAKNGDG
jgi:transcriptional regulator with XRE-family HTH domain